MHLFWQLLPYLLLAGLAAAAGYLYVGAASATRIRQRQSAASAHATKMDTGDYYSGAHGGAGHRGNRPGVAKPHAQILRLHEFGINATQIASVLQLPIEEAELVLRLAAFKGSRAKPADRDSAQLLSST